MNSDSSAFLSFNREVYDEGWNETMAFRIRKAKKYIGKYGVPNERKWLIEYDTSHPIVKMKIVVLPLFSGYDKTNNLETVSLKFGFDHSGFYSPDSVLAYFDVYTQYRSKHPPYYP